MKKIVSVLLALALTLTLVGSAVAEDKVNLTAFQYTLENQSTDFNNLWFFQQIEEKTNTHVDFMIGTSDLSIIGTTKDGREVPVFVNGNFAL